MPGLTHALIASLVLAAISTAGDFVWANWRVRHLMVYGIIHGVAMFVVAGALAGKPGGRTAAGTVGGLLAGAGGALSFYALRPLAGYSAMFVSWILVWVVLAVAVKAGVARGVGAAVVSGAAFYAVSGMWMPFNPAGVADYAEHFVRWTVAFLPGFGALLVGRRT